MSEKREIALITSPGFGVGKETVGYYTGYACGYCQVNGWFLNADIIH